MNLVSTNQATLIVGVDMLDGNSPPGSPPPPMPPTPDTASHPAPHVSSSALPAPTRSASAAAVASTSSQLSTIGQDPAPLPTSSMSGPPPQDPAAKKQRMNDTASSQTVLTAAPPPRKRVDILLHPQLFKAIWTVVDGYACRALPFNQTLLNSPHEVIRIGHTSEVLLAQIEYHPSMALLQPYCPTPQLMVFRHEILQQLVQASVGLDQMRNGLLWQDCCSAAEDLSPMFLAKGDTVDFPGCLANYPLPSSELDHTHKRTILFQCSGHTLITAHPPPNAAYQQSSSARRVMDLAVLAIPHDHSVGLTAIIDSTWLVWRMLYSLALWFRCQTG